VNKTNAFEFAQFKRLLPEKVSLQASLPTLGRTAATIMALSDGVSAESRLFECGLLVVECSEDDRKTAEATTRNRSRTLPFI